MKNKLTLLGGSNEYGKKIKNFFTSDSAISKITIAILFIFFVVLLVHIIKRMVFRLYRSYYSRVWLNNSKTVCPKTNFIIPASELHRSYNELGGTEFTYGFWILINDWSYKYGQWKNVLHKGNPSSWPSRAPGIWLHPKKNAMRFYMNTYDSIDGNYIDIDNLPLHKWFHIVLSVNQLTMDVYVNGNLKKSLKFSSLPKQNYGDLYIQSFRGFDGYLTRGVYYDYSIPYSEIQKLMEMGPGSSSLGSCTKSKSIPPYLSAPWWTSSDMDPNISDGNA